MEMMVRSRALRSVLLGGGLVFLYVGERIAPPDGKLRVVLGVLAVAMVVLAAVVLRVLALRNAAGERRRVEWRVSFASFGVAVALILYGLGTETGLGLLGVDPASDSRLPGIVGVAFPVLLVCSLLPLLFMEFAYASMPSEKSVELRRIDVSAQAGLTLALALAGLFALGYALDGWGKKWDFSYFKTTRPSRSTLRLADRLGEPLKVHAYFPNVNDVRDQVMPYLRELDAASDKVRVQAVDRVLRPSLARDHRVTKNGTVVLAQGQKTESLSVGLDLEDARSKLRRLDRDFQKAFLKLTRPQRTLYVTGGHKERGESNADDPEELGTDDWKRLLGEIGIRTMTLGIAQGLGSAIPEEATAVAILGARERFLPEEVRTLGAYVEGGGHLFLLVDPEQDVGLGQLLEKLDLQLLEGIAANESEHFVRDREKSDRSVIFSNRYSAHPSVTSASRLSSRIASVFIGTGGLDRPTREGAGTPEGRRVTFTVRSLPGTWLDVNGDYEFDEGSEKKENVNFAAAVTVSPGRGGGEEGEGRAVVIADGDFVTDQVLRNPGNVTVVVDALRWLVGEEEIPGPAETEEDVRIEHTREEDVTWFYGTTFVVPLLVLAGGLGTIQLMRRRSRRKP